MIPQLDTVIIEVSTVQVLRSRANPLQLHGAIRLPTLNCTYGDTRFYSGQTSYLNIKVLTFAKDEREGENHKLRVGKSFRFKAKRLTVQTKTYNEVVAIAVECCSHQLACLDLKLSLGICIWNPYHSIGCGEGGKGGEGGEGGEGGGGE